MDAVADGVDIRVRDRPHGAIDDDLAVLGDLQPAGRSDREIAAELFLSESTILDTGVASLAGVRELVETGRSSYYDDLRARTPAGLKERHGEEFAKRFGLGFSAQDREENIRRIGAVIRHRRLGYEANAMAER